MIKIKNISRVKSTPSTSTNNTFRVGKKEEKKFTEEEKMDIISSAKELDIPDKPKEEKTSESFLEKVDPKSIDKTSKTTYAYKAPPVYRVPVSPKKNPFAKKPKYTDKQEVGALREMSVPEGRRGMFNMWCDYLEDMKYT